MTDENPHPPGTLAHDYAELQREGRTLRDHLIRALNPALAFVARQLRRRRP